MYFRLFKGSIMKISVLSKLSLVIIIFPIFSTLIIGFNFDSLLIDMLFFLFVFLPVLYFLKTNIILPVKKITQITKAFAHGGYDFDLPPESHDEIGDLIRAFKEMAAKRKQIEKESAKHRKLIESILYNAPDAIVTLDEKHRVLDWNPGAESLFGYKKEETLGINLDDLVAKKEVLSEAKNYTKQVLSGKIIKPFEAIRYRKDGTPVNVIAAGSPIYVDEELKGVVAVYTDITWQKKNEEALKLSQERLDLALKGARLGLWDWDIKTGNMIYNERWAEMLGYKLNELELHIKTWHKLVHPGDKKIAIDAMKKHMDGKTHFYEAEYRMAHKSGNWVWVIDKGRITHRDENGKPLRAIGIHVDITERKHAEEEMEKLRIQMRNIIDSMPSVLVGTDLNGRVIHWNKEAEKVTGKTACEAKGKLVSDVFPYIASHMDKIRASIEKRAVRKEARIKILLKGESRIADFTVYPLMANGAQGAVIRLDDVTDRVRIEEMMIQSEKMLSIGGLAAGMAHEINNPLGGIIQNLQVMKNRLSGAVKKDYKIAIECGTTMESIKNYHEKRNIFNMIEEVIKAGNRASAIVHNMLSFARKSHAVFSSHDLKDILDHTVLLAATDYNLKKKYDFREIAIIREYEPDLPYVPCEESKIKQVFLNILKNSAEAMMKSPETRISNPKIILRVKKEKEWVRVEIEDNGPGMDEKIRKRVFEPFFTTKETGKGTGLGLSISFFIINDHHRGNMSVESWPGKGTKFIIKLPLTREYETYNVC